MRPQLGEIKELILKAFKEKGAYIRAKTAFITAVHAIVIIFLAILAKSFELRRQK